MYQWLRPCLFKMDPEFAHDFVLTLLRLTGALPPVRHFLSRAFSPASSQPVSLAGINFPNRVGLAAGFDKNGTAWRGLACLGFGHLELGTVTMLPQKGNPRPRIFRFPDQEALINRMGFPGKGADYVARRLPLPGSLPERERIILGMNIGRNKETSNKEAALDYLGCMRSLYRKVDYFTVNVSSPNTIGLRELQGKEFLEDLLHKIMAECIRLREEVKKPLPVFVKLSPDLSDQDLDDALEVIISASADGVIASNTTIQREGLMVRDPGIEGGLSGEPLKEISTRQIREIHRRTGGKLPIIGVGGISSVEDALEKLDTGADLIQVYSGMVFQGPGLIPELVGSL